MWRLLLIIGTGGFLGSVSRFLLSRLIQNMALSAFPYGTFIVNMMGSLFIGFLYGLSVKENLLTPEWRLFLTVGFCGSFTTFSTFINENVALLRDGDFFHFAFYTGLSIFIGIMAVFLGNYLTKMI
ncbi:MAG: fluoride efflux transporter CrcB [Bacteroidales bacterium]|nr:fluoride efflux transporter CrcB [Bacteroidales bacterium]